MISLLEAWLPWIFIPALTLSILAQLLVQYVLVRSEALPTRMSGYAVGRHILDGAGRYDVEVQQAPGQLSDHFDARRAVLQLSDDVYHGRHVASMAIAAHEASHALQSSGRLGWMWLREVAVSAATFGSGGGILIALVGLLTRFPPLLALGMVLFSATVYLQLLNLPIEWHASLIARRRLVALEIVDPEHLPWMGRALWATSLTYVGSTLQSVLTLAQRFVALLGRPRDRP